MAESNGRNWPVEASLIPPPATSEMTMMQLARNRRAMLLTFVIASAWLATGLLYYGFAMSCENLEGSIYVRPMVAGVKIYWCSGMDVDYGHVFLFISS